MAIAGASDLLGLSLARALSPSHRVIALERTAQPHPSVPGVDWRAFDLFNLREAEEALAGAEMAVYLVHSPMPSARLTQGRLEDLELICADNFARAAAAVGVRGIVYLGGLLHGDSSRREVEWTLASRGVPLTTLRAGRILLPQGGVVDLTSRPGVSDPRAPSLPLAQVVSLLGSAVHQPALWGRAYDLVGADAQLLGSPEPGPPQEADPLAGSEPPLLTRPHSHDRRVCSVQRLAVGEGRDATWVAGEYVRWLPRFLRHVLKVTVAETGDALFWLWPIRRPLLVLTFAPKRSTPDRQLFFVTGGMLRGEAAGARPRLEFRSVLEGAFVLAAIHDFVPRLPWLLYMATQARVHLWVMRAFARHLAQDAASSPSAPSSTG
ncbi:MAG: hypothetical protein M3Y59_05480 [Myxococcota bacterium]|nr:hypothetical protein [Myxococcota bacterium]